MYYYNIKKTLRFQGDFFKLGIDFWEIRCYNCKAFEREWRNWQTRTFEGRVDFSVRVQVPFLAPTKAGTQ